MMFVAAVLWSIHEHLRGRPGCDQIPMLTLDWMDDLCRYAVEQSEEVNDILAEQDRQLAELRAQRGWN